MDLAPPALTSRDRLYLERAYELAARGIGSTSPNPPVGAVVVRDGSIAGEGYHRRAGCAHAESIALDRAGEAARGATLYLSLEPCARAGRVPACAPRVVEAGIARVVCGSVDPNPANGGRGVAFLRAAGVEVAVSGDARARELIEIFAGAIASTRPYLALKMAMSLDGVIASRSGVREQLGSEAERLYVRDLRIAYDAVMVGAGTVRVDDPQLTVRPPHDRLRPYVRVVACETETIPSSSRVLAPVDGYAPTIVLAPAGLRSRFENVSGSADVKFVGGTESTRLDLRSAMEALRESGISSVLCEGGPTLGARLIADGLVGRFYWAIAPRLIGSKTAVPVLAGVDFAAVRSQLRFDRALCVGDDVVISGRIVV